MDREAIARAAYKHNPAMTSDQFRTYPNTWRDAKAYQGVSAECARAVRMAYAIADDILALQSSERGEGRPLDMLLFCPCCHVQHVDEPDERTPEWDNPPHRSHLCHACRCIWRPADVPTNGVRAIATRGKADTWSTLSPAEPSPESREGAQGAICNIPNCRRACPAHEPFCSEHRQ